MRIHTKLTAGELVAAARIPGVGLTYSGHGSRSNAHAFEVSLTGTSSHRPNSGRYGAGDDYAATWDEWGIFLGRIFEADPSASATYYSCADEFHWMTGDRFRSLEPADQHKRHRWGYPGRSAGGSYFVTECPCGAIQRRLASMKWADFQRATA